MISSSKMDGAYFPTIPPHTPRAALDYCRSVFDAPYTALAGVVVDGRQPSRHPVTPRCRLRNQVGSTNRWRLPHSLGSDLLGVSQAVKAASTSCNQSFMNIRTAENPKNVVNLDVSGLNELGEDAGGRSRFASARQSANMNKRTKPASPHPRPITGVGALNTFVPSNARPAKPRDIFLYHIKRTNTRSPPDVLLECLGLNWELHKIFLYKADVLSSILKMAEKAKSNETKEKQSNAAKLTTISLNITDPLVTQTALAMALGNLYHDVLDIDKQDVVGVLAAAYAIRAKHLQDGCAHIMLRTINHHTVCTYHYAAGKYAQNEVMEACEKWLELNLISKLASHIQLREVPIQLLDKVVRSTKLFSYQEFSVFKMLSFWIFMQLNPHIQLMPSYTTILSYFNSLPRSQSLLEREEGEGFLSLLMGVRLHGITDTAHLHNIQSMNIVPQQWLIKVLSQHYHALQAGGDFFLLNNFETGAIRQGFILDDEPHYHSEIFSLHGFHFELRAVRQSKPGLYSFFLQRVNPSDPVLSFRHCERHTFSMRPDRDVNYSIRIQYYDSSTAKYQSQSTGMQLHRFGLGAQTSRSGVFNVEKLCPPLYVTYSLHFPPS